MRSVLSIMAALFLVACGQPESFAPLTAIPATTQTEDVQSIGDAADDPVIWIHPTEPENSLILGTDKRAGLYAYDLSGKAVQFLPTGMLNNVDLRQDITVGDWQGDLVVASNRSDDTIAVFEILSGQVAVMGSIPSVIPEPYGICMGTLGGHTMVAVAHKTGDLVLYQLSAPLVVKKQYTLTFDSQLEGCVFDDARDRIFIGEELAGIWLAEFADETLSAPVLVDPVGGATGLVADIEGLTLYHGPDSAYLLASSQGDNSFAVYDLDTLAFLTRFRIDGGVGGRTIDAVEDTDGIDVTAAALGPEYPKGVFVVQDGKRPGSALQNFKLVDWRKVAGLLD